MEGQPEIQKIGPSELCGSEGCLVRFHSDTLHDLASPVNQLSTMLALFRKRYRVTPDGDDAALFGMIESAASRLKILMRGLEKYAKVMDAMGPHQPCDTKGLLVAALSSIDPPIHESDAVVTHDELPQLHCDPNQIVYALAHLIDNSIKFRSESRPEIHISSVVEGDEWVFSIRDNGIGIDPKHGGPIFHLFKRLNGDKYAGAGVGLTICQAIIERHGGRLWLGTHPGPGASFFFTMPRPETLQPAR